MRAMEMQHKTMIVGFSFNELNWVRRAGGLDNSLACYYCSMVVQTQVIKRKTKRKQHCK